MDLSYILKSAPHKTLEKQITKNVKSAVDKKIFPYEKFFTREAVASGPLILAFIDLGWARNSIEFAYLRAKCWVALINFILKRVAELRERSRRVVITKCIGESGFLVVFCSRFGTNPLLLSTVGQNWQTWR